MVDEDRDQIITSSYGQPCEEEEEEGQPGTQQALNYLFQQGAAQGQTFLGAAGDNGSDNCEEVHRETIPQPGQNPLSAGEIASQPYVLGVGGTTITDATQPAQEHVWNDGAEGGAGGGGISRVVRDAELAARCDGPRDRPARQRRLRQRGQRRAALRLPDRLLRRHTPGAAASTPCRLEPDVSAQADEYTGAVTVYSEEYRGRGEWKKGPTAGSPPAAPPRRRRSGPACSRSPTPRRRAAANPATASGVGFVSPLLYAIASNPAHTRRRSTTSPKATTTSTASTTARSSRRAPASTSPRGSARRA